jgi:hypothetical protein
LGIMPALMNETLRPAATKTNKPRRTIRAMG